MKNICFYNTKECTGKLTREHIISKNVLLKSFGNKNENISSLPNGKTLIDYEAIIKDVCSECNNNKLSPYDAAGGILIDYLINNKSKKVPFSKDILCWILKTHLNNARTIKDKETDKYYNFNQTIKDFIIDPLNNYVAFSHFKLYFELWEDNGINWDKESEHKIPFFSFTSMRFISQEIIVFELRIRQLSTLLLLPYNHNIKNFNKRCSSALDEIKKDFGYSFDEVDIRKYIKKENIYISSFMNQSEIEKIKKER